jgi:SAM-dependent methyltransferase
MSVVFAGRARTLERRETEATSPEDLARCLRDIDRLTVLARGHHLSFAWLDRLPAGRSRLSVLDIGCGDGALLRRIHAWARRAGRAVALSGVDLDPRAIAAARAVTDPALGTALGIRFMQADARALALSEPFDVILGLHLAHHLADADLPPFLVWRAKPM